MYKANSFYKSDLSTQFGNPKVFYFLVPISVVMAILFGLIAVTANPIIISLAVALMAGAILLVRVDWIVWLILSLGLLVTGLLPLFFDSFASKAGWGVSLLGIMLLLIALVRIVITPEARKNTPAFVWIALVFMIYALINTLLQWHSFGEMIGGFKRYFQIWGLLFALCWMTFDKQQIRYWKFLLLFIALVQLPFAVYERAVYVPIREGLQHLYPGMVPIDVVSGTFGATLTGGGASAEMALFLIAILAFLSAQRMEKVLSNSKFFLLTPIILAPLLLTEVKAVIIMLPLMFLILYRSEILVKFHQWIISLVAVTIFVVATSYANFYAISQNKEIIQNKKTSMADYIEDSLAYNFYDKGHYGTNTLNRTTALIFWVKQQGLHDPVSFVFGNGLGSSQDSLSKRYHGIGIGLTTVTVLLWEMGILGFGLFSAIFASAWVCANQLRCESVTPEIRADAAAIQVVLGLFVFYIFYRPGLMDSLSMQIVFTALLGYQAWLYRRVHVHTTA